MQISQIEIDIFSGRPNPAWIPAAAASKEMLQHISTATPVNCGPAPDALGYKGFIITISNETNLSHTQKVRVFAGKIWYSNPDKCYKDALLLESLLVKQAESNGFAQLIKDLHL